MDSYGFIDTVQVEKANALARYRRFNMITRLFRAIEVFIALALISWSSTRLPSVFKLSVEYLYSFSPYVLNQHVVFLVGNVIVIVCYALSGHGHGHGHVGLVNESNEPVASEDASFMTTPLVNHKTDDNYSNPETKPEPQPPPALPPVELVSVTTVDAETSPVNEVEDVVELIVKTESETAIKQAVKQIEKFNRTQSAKLSRVIAAKPKKDLRRSVTERRRSVSVTGDGDSYTSVVESLSNEEFRLAVEAFILKQQSLLKQQSM
ncbi:uncharacterized protein LOC143543689 [Bidens hawaiensis]|uniref:uncharacterized protein LOC143543689 n=1 Tax=Bidens hawaiensis TaxID=980011 RepID=UPI00404A94CA